MKKYQGAAIAEENVLVENKPMVALSASDEAQLFNYLKITELRAGLLF